jgi:hypothetical protein
MPYLPFMRIRTPFAVLAALLLVVTSALSQAPQTASKPSLLPNVFAGWEKSPDDKTGTDPSVVDPASSRVLKEYGFTDFQTATYTKADRKLTVKAARFQDASGAYGAFTFYRAPNMQTESIGAMAASANERVLFFSSNVLVMADFDRVTATSAGELRELAQDLPAIRGPSASLPSLPGYFPKRELVPNSAKFIVGPEALATSGAPVNAALVDFSAQPEILLGKYAADGSNADFMLLEYPTPEIAGARMRVIEAANQAQDGVTFQIKRTGPLVALVKGTISNGDAKSLLGRINYEADVTWNENAGNSKRDNIGNLVIAASILAGLIFVVSVVTGGLFGFGRVFMEKVFPKQYAAHEQKTEFIKLHLEE